MMGSSSWQIEIFQESTENRRIIAENSRRIKHTYKHVYNVGVYCDEL